MKTCRNAIEATTFAHKIMEKGAAVLLKGSHGDIYLEEATKTLLHDQEDVKYLVRQDAKWLEIKREFFEEFTNFDEDEV